MVQFIFGNVPDANESKDFKQYLRQYAAKVSSSPAEFEKTCANLDDIVARALNEVDLELSKHSASEVAAIEAWVVNKPGI